MQRVSQKQIASYIGVTPEFFSKMKSKTVEGIKNEPLLTRLINVLQILRIIEKHVILIKY